MSSGLADVWLDVKFAVRTFARRPGFTAVAVLMLALGIGATTAVFSMVDAVLLRPLPYRNPDRLAAVWITSTREKGLAKLFAVYRDYAEFRRHSRTLESVSAATWATGLGRVLTGYGPAHEVMVMPATVGFFDTLGVPAVVGRTFRAEDEGKGCSIVVSHQFWVTTFGSEPSLPGRSITLNRAPCTVLGVLPESFGFYPRETQAWVLMGPDYQPEMDKMLVGIFVRLKPGVTHAQAQSELHSLFRAIHTSGETRDFEPVVFDLHGEFTFLAGRTLRTTLMLTFAAVLLVLLIACLNVANLLLARLSERRKEMAVRVALGSGQARLVRQVLTEGLLLAGCGAALGVALAYGAVQYFRAASPIELTVGADVRVSPLVLGFSAALAIATTLIFGLLPALRASRVDLASHLKAAGRGITEGRQGLARVMIAAEMAFSFLLLMGAALFITSALRMGSEPLGFAPEHVLVTRLSPPAYRYGTDARRLELYDRLLERVEHLPGVAGAALGSKVPPESGGNQVLEVQGRPVAEGMGMHDTGADAVTPAFFDTLGVPLRRGRAFGPQDRETSQPVVLVNEALVRKYFPEGDPLGKQIRLAGGTMPWLTVVGVVGNLKHTELMNEMAWVESPILYRPLAQEPRRSIMVAVRTAGEMGATGPEVQRAIAGMDAAIPINAVEPLSGRLARTMAYPRFRATVLAFFALSALLLSAAGLHGVLAQLVSRRTVEFGVRRAVGAQTRHLILMVVRQGGVPAIAGLAVGAALTVVLGRAVAGLLYGMKTTDMRTIGLVSVALLVVAALAILLPARRAARIDPMAALREE